ncbi:MAG: flagellin [Alphaproteobacteria bacterium]|nr:flagellin [Alphaproteobacteria bacterium]NCQ87577.1 flagellin [Alphaproteobacteria bacterium]NCT06446.1 flagellin [Alphaproteobacteria bacterium]
MSGDIVLNAALRSNLLSLQNTQRGIDTTQLRLATGLKVNSALDGPQAFFTAQSLNNRANDFSRLLDGISQSIRTIEAANTGTEALSTLINQAESIALEAQTELRSGQGFTRVRGNEDVAQLGTNLRDGTIISATANSFDITYAEADGSTGTATITVAANETIDSVVASINNSAALNGTTSGEGISARVTAGGQLEIQANGENTSIRIEASAANGLSLAGFQRLGLGTVVGAEGATIGGTSVAGDTLSSRAYLSAPTGANGKFEASETLANAGYIPAGASTLDVTIDGTTTSLGSFASTSSVQDVIDAFNNSGIDVEASFNEDTGQIDLDFGGDVGQVAFAFGGTVAFGFGNSTQADGAALTEQFTFDGVTVNVDQLEDDYNNVREQINQLVEDAGYRGVNLLNGDDLTTFFNEDRTNTLRTDGVDFTALGLGLEEGDFTNLSNIRDSINQAKSALEDVRRFGSSIANDLAIVQVRQQFTEQTINTLKSGADDLTVADQNEEGANLLSLQTRQQLGVTSLSLAAQSQQSILRLF